MTEARTKKQLALAQHAVARAEQVKNYRLALYWQGIVEHLKENLK